MSGVTGVVLAGGQGRRMGGIDKGLVEFRGQPLIAHVIERLRPQVDAILVNANRNGEAYAALGHPVISDQIPGYAGPLAGFERGLAHARSDLVAVVPCDSPFLPADLVARLRAGLEAQQADAAVAQTAQHSHPVFCLMRRGVHASLQAYLAGGDRKVELWFQRLKIARVLFPEGDGPFANINTVGELAELERPPS